MGEWGSLRVVWYVSWEPVIWWETVWGHVGFTPRGHICTQTEDSGFFPQLGHWLAVWLWVSQLHFLYHPFLICKANQTQTNPSKKKKAIFLAELDKRRSDHLHPPFVPMHPLWPAATGLVEVVLHTLLFFYTCTSFLVTRKLTLLPSGFTLELSPWDGGPGKNPQWRMLLIRMGAPSHLSPGIFLGDISDFQRRWQYKELTQ